MKNNFNLYFLSRMSVNIADSIYMIGILWMVQSIGNESVLTGITYAAISVSALFAIFSGEIIDRSGPLKISKITVLIQAVLLIMILILFVLNINNLYLLIFLVFLASLASNIFYPASNSLLAYLFVDSKELNKGNSLVQSSDQVINLVGYLFAGVLIALIGSLYTISLSIIALLIAFISFNFIKIKQNIGADDHSFETKSNSKIIEDLKNGLKTINTNLIIKNVLVVSSISSFFVATLIVLLPSIAESYGNSIVYSALYVSFFIGFIIGAIVSNLLPFSGKMFGLVWVGNGLSLIPFILINHWIALGISVLLYGIFSGINNVHLMTFIQKSVTQTNLGKVFSVLQAVNGLTTTLGALFAGFFISHFSYQFVMIFGLILFVLCGFFLLAQEQIRNYVITEDT